MLHTYIAAAVETSIIVIVICLLGRQLGERFDDLLETLTSKVDTSSRDLPPEAFEANKERLTTRVLQALENENHPSLPTRAYCIIEHSGLGEFLTSPTKNDLQKALARLIVNGDQVRGQGAPRHRYQSALRLFRPHIMHRPCLLAHVGSVTSLKK